MAEEPVADILRISESVARRQIERLNTIRAARDNDAVRTALADLINAAATDLNLLPFILKCVESYASVGEISDALRAVWGEYKE
jgi:methylmalonyl-CoA mutase N-terminal domain/subunit